MPKLWIVHAIRDDTAGRALPDIGKAAPLHLNCRSPLAGDAFCRSPLAGDVFCRSPLAGDALEAFKLSSQSRIKSFRPPSEAEFFSLFGCMDRKHG